LRIDPRNITARLDLAQLESSNGNHRSSLEVAEPVANELRHLADGLILLATDYAALGQKERIRPLVQDWEVLADVPPVDLTVDFASVLIGSGLVPEGIRLLEARKARNVSSWRLELTLGEAYAAEGKLSQAEENYQAALGLNRDCLPCLMKIAALSERQANTEKALSFLMRAKAMAPDDPEVLFQFGKVCFERDLLDDAVPALEKAAALRPDNDTYAYVLGSAYVGKGTNAKAVQTFQKLVLKHPADAAVNYALGAALFLNEDADKAEPYLQKSIELQPRQKLAYYYLGLAAEKKGDATRAIAMLRDLTDRYPDYPQAQAALGSALLREKQYPEAEVRLRSAIRLDPNLVQAHYQLGRLLARTGRDDESRKEIETARRLERDERAKKGQQIRILDPEQAN
jgi:tetratricopeptide (TPR) repeat protein